MRSARGWRGASVVVAALAVCCDDAPPAPPPPLIRGNLEEGAVARVGPLVIPRSDVEAVVARQRVEPEEALGRLVRDALFAIEAERQGLASDPPIRALVRSALARTMVATLHDEAYAEGPVTAEELQLWTDRAWLELARPEGLWTVHALVTDNDTSASDWTDAKRQAARELAEVVRKRIEPAVSAARTSPPPRTSPQGLPEGQDAAGESFVALAKAVTGDGFKIVAQPLAMTVDGMSMSSRAPIEAAYTEAAKGLAERGALSEVVETPFGAHVIMLLGRSPSQMVPESERRRILEEPIIWSRVEVRQKKLLGAREGVWIDPQAEGILAELSPAGAGAGVR